MTGVVAGLIASVKKIAGGAVNLVVNGSVDTAVTSPPWVVGSGVPTRNTSIYHSSPASGINGSDVDGNSSVYYSANSVLTIGKYYSISFWVFFPTASPTFGDVNLYYATGFNTGGSGYTITPNVWTYIKIENQLCTSATVLAFQFYDISSHTFYIDDIWVVEGATAH